MASETERAALGAVLAGGRGSRLGGCKAMAELAGRPMISYPLAAFEAAGIEAIVVAKPDTELPRLAVEVLREPAEPVHPLAGIVAALSAAGGRAVVVAACDMPLLEPALLTHLAGLEDRLAVPSLDGSLQPLLARYGPELLPDLELALAEREPLRRTVSKLGPHLIERDRVVSFGQPERLLLNVNDREQLRRAERMLAERA